MLIGKEDATRMEKPQHMDMNEWYSPTEAAQRLTANSGKKIDTSYVRTLARYGKVRFYRISARSSLYYKEDIDRYIVEERGEKSARAKRQAAKKQTQQPSRTR
jgi:hypothetical protein